MFSLFINSYFIILSIKYSFITIFINIENIMENYVDIGKNLNYSFHIVYIGTGECSTVQLYTV